MCGLSSRIQWFACSRRPARVNEAGDGRLWGILWHLGWFVMLMTRVVVASPRLRLPCVAVVCRDNRSIFAASRSSACPRRCLATAWPLPVVPALRLLVQSRASCAPSRPLLAPPCTPLRHGCVAYCTLRGVPAVAGAAVFRFARSSVVVLSSLSHRCGTQPCCCLREPCAALRCRNVAVFYCVHTCRIDKILGRTDGEDIRKCKVCVWLTCT